MLIKEADDQTQAMEELERLAAGNGPEAKQAGIELRNRKAGLKGEAESAYLINFDYGSSPNWAVIHDLRLEHGGRTAQIDHLLINRWMEFFVLETKKFHAGVKITEEGEFLRWNDFRKSYEGMPSPLQQNERHVAVLSDVVGTIEFPSRFGLRITPTFNSLVLVDPSARIDRPEHFDTSRVIKSDQLKPRIWRDLDLENPVSVFFKAATRMVSGETVRFVAEQLVSRHNAKANAVAAETVAREVLPDSTHRLHGGRAAPAGNQPGDKSSVRPRKQSPASGWKGRPCVRLCTFMQRVQVRSGKHPSRKVRLLLQMQRLWRQYFGALYLPAGPSRAGAQGRRQLLSRMRPVRHERAAAQE